MRDFTENDLAAIERDRDINVPEPDEKWCVEFDNQIFGPFDSEDACYTWAATHSREPNDWTPRRMENNDA